MFIQVGILCYSYDFFSPEVEAQPVRDSSKVTDIWVVFRTHFDLGFTDLAENVFKRYRVEMMDKALALIENNKKQPPEKRFSWSIAGWPLYAQMLGPLQTPERKLRIEKAIREGSIVFDGLPFTMQTESLDYEDLVRGLDFSSAVARKYGVPLPISAKMTDVPSHSWILPTLLKNAGIQFLQLGCNPASQYPRFPDLFWWEGPDGSKILCNYTYLYGSGIEPPADWPCKNYLAMVMTGDNHGPPTIQEINKLLDYAAKELPGVNIHFGTLDDFARAVFAENPDLPTVKGDCPDTWIQGLQSNPVETKIARNIRPLEPALDGLHTQMKSWGIAIAPIAAKLAKAYEQSLLYGEHTWGMNAEYGPRYSYGDAWKKWMAEAAAEPFPPNGNYAALKNSNAHHTEVGSKRKWLRSYEDKRQYIRNTNEIVSSELTTHLNLLAASINKKGKLVVVYNPLPWKRSGMIKNPWDKGKYFYVKGAPASGYKSFSFNELKEGAVSKDESATFITPYFKVVFDLKKGGITSLVEKSTGRELVDQSSKYVIGQFLHERFSKNEVDEWFNAYSRIKGGWGLNDLGKPGMPDATESPYLAFTPTAWKIKVTHTAVADIAVLTSDSTDGFAKSYTLTFTFPSDAAYVDVKWSVESKVPEKIPEGGWLCFPFNVEKPTFILLLGISLAHGQIRQASRVVSKYRNVLLAPPSHTPSKVAIDAPLLGNGFTAVTIAGKPEQQNYYLARNDLWRLKSKVNNSFPAVLGKLSIDIPALKNATYRTEQDLYTATTYAIFSKAGTIVKIRSIMAATQNVLLIAITNNSKVSLKGGVELNLPGSNQLQAKNKFPDTTAKGFNRQGVQWILRGSVKDVDIPTTAVVACKIVGSAGNTFLLVPGKTISIVCAFSSNFKNSNSLKQVKQEVENTTHHSILQTIAQHKQWWRSFWNESFVNIGDSLLEHQYYASQYIIASCCRDPKFPPGIFGSWITKEIPAWNGDYHLNYNYSAPFYALYSSNHLLQALPYITPLLDFMPRGKFYSKKMTSIPDGILYPVGIGPLGIETVRLKPDSGMFRGQKSNAAYCVTDLAMQFYRTYDEQFTKRVYPFGKATAIFWQHYLKKDHDRYIIVNDAVQEGAYGTLNSILSLGLVPMVFKTAIDMSRLLGVDSSLRSDWQYKADHIAKYTTQMRDGKTVFRYSEKGPAWWENNTLGIQEIYPAGAIGLNSNPGLLQIARNTISVMQRWQDFNGSNSFFPAAVRVGYNPDTILHQLRIYSKNTYLNGFRRGNPHGIENCSTVPNTINQMLCMSNQNLLCVFEIWPKNKDASFYNIRCEGAFLVSSALKKGYVEYVHVISEKGRTLVLQNPWPGKTVLVTSNKTAKELRSGERITINTLKGEVLMFRENK